VKERNKRKPKTKDPSVGGVRVLFLFHVSGVGLFGSVGGGREIEREP
jgi:hypothetical protein